MMLIKALMGLSGSTSSALGSLFGDAVQHVVTKALKVDRHRLDPLTHQIGFGYTGSKALTN